jgi:hypothetical protein
MQDEGGLARRTSTSRVREAGQAYKPNKADWLDGKWSGLSKADNEDERAAARPACR